MENLRKDATSGWKNGVVHQRFYLTTSCTHATEMAAILADIKPGDEVIMPAYTFVSTADAFVFERCKSKIC